MIIKTLFRAALIVAMPLAGMSAASATEAVPAGKQASIPFADRGGIQDFRADGNRALYLQDRSGRWYRAELMGYCSGLNFAEAIGYETSGAGRFDRFSQIRTGNQVCNLSSLVTADAPSGRKASSKGK